jgi:two-component system, chemotaxis family, CheB/CheR fusion protein
VICAAEPDSAETGTRTILLVDDDRAVVDTFSRMLKLEGYTVAAALDPTAGLELADNLRPDAIILDMRMPLISGLQFLRQVRKRPHLVEVPVAIVTGDYFLPDALQQEVKALGAALKFKPMWLEDLVELAHSLAPQ